MITIQFELNKNSLLKKRNIKGSTEHSKETTESQRLSTVVQGEEKKKQWLHSYNFILVTLEIVFGLTEEVYLAGNVFKNSARHECKRILLKSVKT